MFKSKIAVAQIEVISGQPDRNLKTILTAIKRERQRGAEMIIFPEMALPGYLLGDEWENKSFLKDLEEKNKLIVAASEGMVVIWGSVLVDWDKKGEDGRERKYNAVFIAQNGQWVANGVFDGFSIKTLLPKYREFDDERHFYSLRKLAEERGIKLSDLLQPFKVMIKKETLNLGLTLCEDMWWNDYLINPTKILTQNGADLIINISCSPWTWRKNNKRNRVVREIINEINTPFIYCNNTGIQNNGKNIYLFDGNSTVYDKTGKIIFQARDYQNEIIETWKSKIYSDKEELSNYRDTVELYRGLVYGIKKFLNGIGKDKVVIGLSGGIDSAVTAALLVAALGPKNVYGVNLPSQYNSDLTKNAAEKLATNLGIKYAVVPIQKAVDLTKKQLEAIPFGGEVNQMVMQNIQARDRGSRLLAGIAASLEGVFTNNGNKTEIALGYATLYGDINGVVAPIGDLYKGEVYQLADYINRHQTIIPKEILKVTPSAELSADQDVNQGKGDPFDYPYHDQLVRSMVEFRYDPEQILALYRENKLETEFKLEAGTLARLFPQLGDFINDLEEKWRLYKINIFKRVQAPPIIAVSRRAFGFDLREAQNGVYWTKGYRELKSLFKGDLCG